MGYTIDAVENGRKALEIMEHKSFDIILMDVQMPVMNGLEATQAIIEKYPENVRPFIIAITANAMPGDRERFLEAGMVDYLIQTNHGLKTCRMFLYAGEGRNTETR